MRSKLFTVITLCALAIVLGCKEGQEQQSAAAPQSAGPDNTKVTAEASGPITWGNSLAEGLTLALSSKKPLMVDFYAEWCHWCKKLDKDVYTDAQVSALAKEFVCVKVDTDKAGADASKYGVQGLPTIVFMNADGTVIDKIVGYNPAPEFAAAMKKALKK